MPKSARSSSAKDNFKELLYSNPFNCCVTKLDPTTTVPNSSVSFFPFESSSNRVRLDFVVHDPDVTVRSSLPARSSENWFPTGVDVSSVTLIVPLMKLMGVAPSLKRSSNPVSLTL